MVAHDRTNGSEVEGWRYTACAGCEVSSLGRIRLFGRPLTSRDAKKKYLSFQIRGKRLFVHRLVCIAFHGQPHGVANKVNHINENTRDNRAENLEWVTAAENTQHSKMMRGIVGIHAHPLRQPFGCSVYWSRVRRSVARFHVCRDGDLSLCGIRIDHRETTTADQIVLAPHIKSCPDCVRVRRGLAVPRYLQARAALWRGIE